MKCIGLRGRVSLLFPSGLIVEGLGFEFAGRYVAQRECRDHQQGSS